MFRSVATLTLLGVLLVPDWATAIGWRFRQARQARLAHRVPPVRAYYAPPAYFAPPPVVFVPPCPPVVPVAPVISPAVYPAGPSLPPPTVHVAPPAAAAPARTPAPGNLATPSAAPPDIPVRRVETPARPPMTETSPAPKPAADDDATTKLPKLDLPLPDPTKEKESKPSPPADDPPKLDLPPVPPKKSEERSDVQIPPLVVPQLPPLAPPTEAKYRPTLDDRPTIAVLPVDGSPPAGSAWKVGFYNYTGRDLELRVEGRAVKLPARSYVTAAVPGTFTWAVGGSADEKTTIPATSGGVEIVLK